MGLPSSFPREPTPQQAAGWRVYPKYLPQPDWGSCQHLAEGELLPPTPGLSQRWELRGARARRVPWTAPHSPSSFSSNTGALWEWLPPMLVHSRLRIPRRQHSAGPAVTPASGQLPSRRPSPARPGRGSFCRASSHPVTWKRSVRPWQRALLARTDLARLSSRRGRGGRELGEEGGRRRRSCRWWLLVSGKSWIYLDPSGSSFCFASSDTSAGERGVPAAAPAALSNEGMSSSQELTGTRSWGLPGSEATEGLWGVTASLG